MIYLIFTSTSKDSLILYSKFIKLILKKLSVEVTTSGIITRKKRIVLLKSPHVYKKSKEHFEINQFRLCLCIKRFANSNLPILKYFVQNKPKSITLKIKKIER